MNLTKIIRFIVKKNPQLKYKLRQTPGSLSPFQYVFKVLSMTAMTVAFGFVLVVLISRKDFMKFLLGVLILFPFSFLAWKFWFGIVDVKIKQFRRKLEKDLLFVSEYFLVSISSGLPIQNSVQNISYLKRPAFEIIILLKHICDKFIPLTNPTEQDNMLISYLNMNNFLAA